VKRAIAACLTVCALVLATGCATTNAPAAADGGASAPATVAQPQPANRADPWENWNRKVYGFNTAIDDAVVRPVAEFYTNVVPQPVRTGVTNFFGNFADAWSAVNNLLQGKLADTGQDLARVGTNTIFGLGGIFDVATDLGIDPQREDFGQTLGRWGVPAGPYVVWPLFGPSTLRDSAALPLDRYWGPALVFADERTQYILAAFGLVNERANLLPATRMLDGLALDKYVFVRDAYLQRRRSLVYDGNEPADEDDFEPDPEPEPEATPAPAAEPASAPAAADPPAPAPGASAPDGAASGPAR